MSTLRIGLDNPAFAGRLRTTPLGSAYQPRPVTFTPRGLLSDILPQSEQSGTSSASSDSKTQQNLPTTHSRLSRSTVLQRQVVTKPQLTSRKTHHKRKVTKIQVTLLSMAGLLFFSGLAVSFMGWRTNSKAHSQVAALTTENSNTGDDTGAVADGDVPAENQPSGAHSVAADAPKTLRIPKMGINSRIIGLGTKADGQLKAPTNIHNTGWYTGSSKPHIVGGATLLAGHVHGPTKPGVFIHLKKLGEGDKIELEAGNGKVYTYRVVSSKSFEADNVDMASALVSAQPGKSGLNIITCDGELSDDAHYSKRLIVYAVRE